MISRKPIPRSPVRLRTKTTKKVIKRKSFGIKAKKEGKVWSLKKADGKFRELMLGSVEVKCVFPGCTITDPSKLTVSHYFGRVKKATRFMILNCDFLCRNHHYWDKQLGWEFQKQREEKHGWDGQYTVYMKKKLGIVFQEVEIAANSNMKPKPAILHIMALFPSASERKNK